MTSKEEYLGDGLYASFDGEQICLRAPRENGNDLVYMDAAVLLAFNDFCKRRIGELQNGREGEIK